MQLAGRLRHTVRLIGPQWSLCSMLALTPDFCSGPTRPRNEKACSKANRLTLMAVQCSTIARLTRKKGGAMWRRGAERDHLLAVQLQ